MVMSDKDTLAPPPREGSGFRMIVGLVALASSILGFAALFVVEIPPGNRDALMFALGGVFGWGSSVVNSEFGASTTGRRAADATIKRLEKNDA
jgi:hypothetical protein